MLIVHFSKWEKVVYSWQLNELLSMKKILLALLTVAVTGSLVHAQKGVHFGFQGQMNSIWIINQNNYEYSQMDYEYKYGILGGATFGYNWDENFGWQVEFNYAQMGQDYSDIIKDFGPVQDPEKPDLREKVLTYRYVDLTYLQVPVIFRYMEGDSKSAVKYQMAGGLQFGYLLNATQQYTADLDDSDPDNQRPVEDAGFEAPTSGVPDFKGEPNTAGTDFFTPFDIGAVVGVGADIYVNDNVYFTPQFRGYIGFFDINSKPTRDLRPAQGEEISRKSHNAYVGFSLAINFMFPDSKLGSGGNDDAY